MNRWWGRAAALALGAPLALAFPRPGWWWLALVGLVPALLLARAAPDAREAAVRAWLAGTGFFLAVDAFLFPAVGVFMVPLAMLLAALWLPLGWLAWHLLGGDAAIIDLLDEGTDRLSTSIGNLDGEARVIGDQSYVHIGEGISGRAVSEHRVVRTGDYLADDSFQHTADVGAAASGSDQPYSYRPRAASCSSWVRGWTICSVIYLSSQW